MVSSVDVMKLRGAAVVLDPENKPNSALKKKEEINVKLPLAADSALIAETSHALLSSDG